MIRNTQGYVAALALTLAAVCCGVSIPLRVAAQSSPGRRADQEALKPFAAFVGDWRGTGMVERGRSKGAWTESANWVWSLTNNSASLEMTVKRGKHIRSATLKPDKSEGTFVLDAILADGSKRSFQGKTPAPKAPLVLKAEQGGDGVRRITLTPLHDNTRLLMLMEAEDADAKTFTRIGEVGYTREGIAFAAGESGPTCVVTEGRGTIKVSHKGKTYWVCCSGCRDLFNDDPEAVLAEAAARQKAKDAPAK